MVNFTIFVGGYTSFVLSYLFDADAGTLTQLQNVTTGENPSWLALHPTNASILYATNEITEGAVQSFQILPGGVLSLLDTTSTEGNGPAYAAPVADGQVAAMNYGSGNGIVTSTYSGGQYFNSSDNLITFPPPDGGVSNPHQVVQYGEELLVTDLGGDKVWRLNGTDGVWAIAGYLQHDKGTGPRHMVVKDDLLFVVHETASTLTVQQIPADPSVTSTPFLSNVSVVPADADPSGAYYAAELLMPKTANGTILYATNRNIIYRDPTIPADPKGDSIAIFEYVEGQGLVLLEQVYTGLQELRGVALGSEIGASMKTRCDGEDAAGAEEYLVALGANSGGMVVYKLADGARNLTEVARDMTVPPRSSAILL